MPQYSSPVIDALKDWKSQEDARQSVLNTGMGQSKAFLKSRLAAYKKIYRDNRHLTDPSHKEDLKALKGQIDQLNKQLYSRKERIIRGAWNLLKMPVMPLVRPLGRMARGQYDRLKDALDDQVRRLFARGHAVQEPTGQDLASKLQAERKQSAVTVPEEPIQLIQPLVKRIIKLNKQGRSKDGPSISG
ncbi:hypothetical protein [Chitinophaga sp. YIM B06452]|uniref:hypothetical protein n=1 Tax=Chitinophaga sp. YIM B06452 TaxID=3082158 RepID=UPI0031FF1463